MTEQQQIEIAAQQCRASFAAHPEATWAWCCHHEIELEPLTEPAEERIKYILSGKPEHERVTRLNNFRPVISTLSKPLLKAGAEYTKAGAEYYKAWAKYYKAYAEYDKACAELNKACAEYTKASAELHEELAPLHKADVPEHTWNGRSIFA